MSVRRRRRRRSKDECELGRVKIMGTRNRISLLQATPDDLHLWLTVTTTVSTVSPQPPSGIVRDWPRPDYISHTYLAEKAWLRVHSAWAITFDAHATMEVQMILNTLN